jgi:hypothetical protein
VRAVRPVFGGRKARFASSSEDGPAARISSVAADSVRPGTGDHDADATTNLFSTQGEPADLTDGSMPNRCQSAMSCSATISAPWPRCYFI